jgi:acyl carrier protein
MEKAKISERIKGMLVEDLFVADSPEEIAEDAKLGTELGMDSVGFVELATMVGEVFEIPVSNTDIGQGHFASVATLTDFIAAKIEEKAASKVEA